MSVPDEQIEIFERGVKFSECTIVHSTNVTFPSVEAGNDCVVVVGRDARNETAGREGRRRRPRKGRGGQRHGNSYGRGRSKTRRKSHQQAYRMEKLAGERDDHSTSSDTKSSETATEMPGTRCVHGSAMNRSRILCNDEIKTHDTKKGIDSSSEEQNFREAFSSSKQSYLSSSLHKLTEKIKNRIKGKKASE